MNDHHEEDTENSLLRFIGYRCMLIEARNFLEQDVSDVPRDPKFEKRVLRGIRKRTRSTKPITVVKILLVACLAVMSLLFTACICIPEVREAMWNAWVEFYDDHMTVTFVKPEENGNETTTPDQTTDPNASTPNANGNGAASGTTTAESTEQPDPPAVPPPSSIEQKAILTYLPEGYYVEENFNATFLIISDVYNSENNIVFNFTQHTIQGADFNVDNEKDLVTNIYINEKFATLIEYADMNSVYTLVWQDECYVYILEGEFSSIYEMRKIAEGIKFE